MLSEDLGLVVSLNFLQTLRFYETWLGLQVQKPGEHKLIE